jgi:flagellar M-ring protein FliF
MDQLTSYGPLQAIAKFWGTLTSTQKFITAVFISTSIVLLVVVSIFVTRPKMTVLFSGLQGEDSGAIVAKLQEKKVAYEIDGTSIKIPDDKVAETRMDLASQGLPQGGTIGFEIFDKGSNFGMTEFSQKLNYQRALQGELSRTIDCIGSIVQSRVHLAIPEEGAFANDKKQPTASVILKMRPGAQLNGDQVAGIVHLVSAAVEGMDPNRVTVVDTKGNMLSQGTDDSTGLDPRMTSSQLQLKRAYENEVEQSVQSMLERVLGPNKAIVRVCAKVNFDRTETNSETYQPATGNNGVIASEEKTEETYSGSGSGGSGGPGGVGGVVGVASNTRPGRAPAASKTASKSGNGYSRIQSNSKYEVSKTTSHVVTAPGKVENISVAVMVDGKVDRTKVTSIQNVVSTAAGINTDRGDKVTVESMTFDDTVAKQEDKDMQAVASKTSYMSIGKTALGVIMLLGFLFFLKGLAKQLKVPIREEDMAAPTLTEVAASPASLVQGYDSTRSGVEPSVGSSASPPEEVAATLRKWMSESATG